MVEQIKQWKTRTRNKILCAGLIFIGVCDLFILAGWFLGRPDAPAILAALNGSGGIWGAVNAVSIAWENKVLRNKEGG
jgi:hypothetical protein